MKQSNKASVKICNGGSTKLGDVSVDPCVTPLKS